MVAFLDFPEKFMLKRMRGRLLLALYLTIPHYKSGATMAPQFAFLWDVATSLLIIFNSSFLNKQTDGQKICVPRESERQVMTYDSNAMGGCQI